MLVNLRGNTHKVWTALTIRHTRQNRCLEECAVTAVPMRNYSDEEIERYIASGDPFDKAGAYAIQNAAFHPVENFNECYACVMGLPLCHVVRQLVKIGYTVPASIAPICLKRLSYPCTISNSVLSFTDSITCCH